MSEDDLTLRDRLAFDRTRLANERTLMAYVRTALAFTITGISLLKFFQWRSAELLGWVFIALSVLIYLTGLGSFEWNRRRIRKLAGK